MDSDRKQEACGVAAAVVALVLLASPAAADSGWRGEAGFVEASDAIERWLAELPDGRGAVAAWRRQIETAPSASRLAAPLRSIAGEYGERAAALATAPPEAPPEWLASFDAAAPSIRLAVADWFALRGRYDACLVWSEGLADDEVFSPELLHYLRAVAARQTVSDKSAIEEVERLDGVTDDPASSLGPARGWVLAALRRELEEKPEPLPVVVRRMHDVERRLSQSRLGEETQQRQQTILDELDELIEKLEEQRKQQQQQASAQGSGGGSAPINPAEESRPSDMKGPGEVDRKRLVAGDAWGSLPPAERERLTQAITRDFPPHYRGLIEDYFKTLAAEADATDPPTAE